MAKNVVKLRILREELILYIPDGSKCNHMYPTRQTEGVLEYRDTQKRDTKRTYSEFGGRDWSDVTTC